MRFNSFLSFLLIPTLTLSAGFKAILNITDPIEYHARAMLSSPLLKTTRTSHITGIEKSITFNDLEPGDYVLQIPSRLLMFQPYIIELKEDDVEPKIYLFQWGLEHQTKSIEIPYPLIIPSIGKIIFDPIEPSFNLWKLLMGNPLILMLLVGAVIAYAMPKLLLYMDPEVMAEVAESQKLLHSKMASFQNMDLAPLSKYLSETGTTSTDDNGRSDSLIESGRVGGEKSSNLIESSSSKSSVIGSSKKGKKKK